MPPVAILAGGLGTRLRSLTAAIPKSLVPVAGEPFVAHQLRLLRSQGVTQTVLCVGHLGKKIESYVGDGRSFGLAVSYSYDGERALGTAGALKKALPFLGSVFWVLYGDSYLETPLPPVLRFFLGHNVPGLMTVFSNQGRWDRSNVFFDKSRIAIYDKVHPDSRMRHIDYGLLLLRATALKEVPVDQKTDLATVLGGLVRAKELLGYEVKNRFYEIGSPEGLRETTAYLEGKSCPTHEHI